MPVKTGWLELQAGAGSSVDPFARLEAGMRLVENVGAFAWGEADRSGWKAGGGVRMTW